MSVLSIFCPACKGTVSKTVFNCVHCGHQIRKPKRGVMGVVFKWTFILFNIIMAYALISGWMNVSDQVSSAQTESEETATAIGVFVGTGMVITFWAVGDIILGMFVMFTRPKG